MESELVLLKAIYFFLLAPETPRLKLCYFSLYQTVQDEFLGVKKWQATTCLVKLIKVKIIPAS